MYSGDYGALWGTLLPPDGGPPPATTTEERAMDPAIIWDPIYTEHDTGAHVESPDRAAAIVTHLEQTDLWSRLQVIKPRPASVAARR